MPGSGMVARRWLQCMAVLLALSIAAPVMAGLSALVRDIDDGSLRAASIDSGDGSVTVGAQAVADCCLVGAGLSAVDVTGERFFAFGRYTAGDNVGESVLMSLSFDGTSVNLADPGAELQAVLAWDSVQERLVSAQLQSTPARSLQWVSVDAASGLVTPIGAALTDCCELLTGLAAVDGAAQRMYVIGRDFEAEDWQLLAVDLSDGSVSQIAAIPAGRPGFLALDDETGQVDLLIQTEISMASDLYRINTANGSISFVASQIDDECCLVTPGATASLDQDGQFWWVAGSASITAPSPGFFALDAVNPSVGVPTTPLIGNYRLHALVVSGAVVNLDILFQDRFEL